MLSKKINVAIAAIVFFGFNTQAQLTIQSGATFTMQTGSQVSVQGSIDNAGVIANEGSLKVQGNYINTGTYSATAGILEMNGTGNSNINAGTSAIANLIINKTNTTDIVKLIASAVVNSSLTLTNGVFTTDPITNPSFNLSSPVSALYTFAAGKEIVGTVKRTSWTAGTARIFNNENMQVTTNGGTAPTELSVTMIPLSAGGDPSQNEREVKRNFGFAQTGGSGFTADVRFPYTATEINTNIENNLVPWTLVGAEWNARLTPVSQDLVNDYVSTAGITATALIQEWKLADPNYTMNITANLRGPWNGVSAMNTSLRTAGIIPLSQQYTGIPFNYTGTETVAAIPANVVDWVLIEHRKPSSGFPADALAATITGRKAGFLLNSGAVVETDGVTAISIPITKQGTAFITIRHRNHLGVLSNAIASNVTGTFSNDYTILANNFKPVGATSDPVVLLAGVDGKYGLWAGDASKNGIVNGGDIITIKNAIAILASGYQFTDVNLNSAINGGDIITTKTTVSLLGSGSGTNARSSIAANPTLKIVKTNIPDPIQED